MQIEHEPTFRAALVGGMNLFLGAGFSIFANSANGKALPVGNTLKEELCEAFDHVDLLELPLPRVYDVLLQERPDDVTAFLRTRFTVASFDPSYRALLNLKLNSIITTNIDDLIYKIFAEEPVRYLHDVIIGGSAFRADDAVDYIPLHGSVMHQDARFTFGTLDLASAFARDPDIGILPRISTCLA